MSAALDRARRRLARPCAVALPLFCLAEVNYPLLTPATQLAVFAGLGIALVFLWPAAGGRPRAAGEGGATPAAGEPGRTGGLTGNLTSTLGGAAALAAALAFAAVSVWLVVQSEPWASRWWVGGASLGNRAGSEAAADLALGAVGLALVVVATWRALGPALPLLALAFLAYGRWGSALPDALLPHRGYPFERLVGQSFLHGQGVYGVALDVMFSYVFPFLVFGTLLEAMGATRWIIDLSRRLFGGGAGGPAKVAVLSSGLMGSLSGSAVANTATTGTFTIPMMRAAGFAPHTAAGLEAAASSGGALVPPVMGAGAYMMLEMVDPPVSYLQIVRAALVPSVLYYLSLYLIVDFRARRNAARAALAQPGTAAPAIATGPEAPGRHPEPPTAGPPPAALAAWEAVVVVASLGALIGFLVAGFSVFRSVTLALGVALATGALHRRTRLGPRRLMAVLEGSSRAGVALVAAAACVGIVLGVVVLTGVGTRLPALILPLAQQDLLLALGALMISSLVLGMGLPSAVCYLLLATLVGPVLGRLGVVPLAAHLFIFYFGMMSMVTPPVALAAYAASSIAGSNVLASSAAAFRFALAGFTLPFLFVFRPALLLLAPDGSAAAPGAVAAATLLAALGIAPLAAALGGWLRRPLGPVARALLVVAAVAALFPGEGPLLASEHVSVYNLGGIALFAAVAVWPVRGGAAAARLGA